MPKKIIKVKNPGNLPTVSYETFKKMEPNAIKDAKNRDIGTLKRAIVEQGFIFPVLIWKDHDYIIDGAGRHMALGMLEYEGYEIPDIIYIPIEAKSKKEAKVFALQFMSKFGKETLESMGGFLSDLKDMDLGFVALEGWDLDLLSQVEIKSDDGEIDMDDLDKGKGSTKFTHVCPKCQFNF